jgi:TolB protein
VLLFLVTALGLLAFAPRAHATFPGANGKIAFVSNRDGNYEIYSVNPDGSGLTRLTNDPSADLRPAWSPDGQRILFNRNSEVWIMNADGSGQQQLTTAGGSNPAWYPDGNSFAYVYGGIHRRSLDGSSDVLISPGATYCDIPPDSPGQCDYNISVDVSPDGSAFIYQYDAVTYYPYYPEDHWIQSWLSTGGPGAFPSFAPDQSRVAFNESSTAGTAVGTMRPDGTDRTIIRSGGVDTAWSPDGKKIAATGSGIEIMNPDGSGITPLGQTGSMADWQPIPINSYPRPRGATPMRISLVPASRQCTAPNSTHGSPLAFGSCAPPQLTSFELTTGTPDSNGLPVRMDASMLLRVVPGDVRIDAAVNDVFKKDLTDYTGSLRAELPVRITDKNNTPSPGGPGAGTTVPFQYGFDIPCTLDPSLTIGSNCTISTTADTLVPGTISASLRTIWQIGRARVDDAGPDGNPDTTADNTVFAVQGLFVP